ncbi:MAG: disulfide bond formation protein DsbA [Verrucomicrobia bacterium]|nr:MAG: disulfide bond formation protein DsbA [Verrucomicrobiota bacterium]
MKVTYYLEVTSSWCYWAEPAWEELGRRYAGQAEFNWKIAQMSAAGYPVSRNQCDWFYRRSGTVMRSPFMLNSGWFEADIKEYLVPNLVAEAARDFGVHDDRVRLAIAHAGMREGRQVGRWPEALKVACQAAGLDRAKLEARARSPEIAERIETSTREFYSLQVTQRPAFLIENSIGDRAVFSGIAKMAPLAAAMDALLADEAAYISFKTHFGDPPSS